ncbi:hypothetical protein E4U40_005661 [Claviceps sp. LM458 group G5]|nr:hypothetical protein E4U40_005661 [Claviceps sp. LM458 group G5]
MPPSVLDIISAAAAAAAAARCVFTNPSRRAHAGDDSSPDERQQGQEHWNGDLSSQLCERMRIEKAMTPANNDDQHWVSENNPPDAVVDSDRDAEMAA